MPNRFETFTSEITTVYRCVHKIKSAEMMEFGLKGGQTMCLFYLYRHSDGLTAAELGVLCDEDKASVSRTIADLENLNFINCQQSGNKKRYRAKLFLTPKGHDVAVSINQRVESAVNFGGKGLSDEERRVFYDVLHRISDNLLSYCSIKDEKQT